MDRETLADIIAAKLATLTHLRLGTLPFSTLQDIMPRLSQLTRLETLHLSLGGGDYKLQVWKGVACPYGSYIGNRSSSQNYQ